MKIINRNYTIEDIMNTLGIKPQFRCLEEYDLINPIDYSRGKVKRLK